jgi:hypothetical protein
MLQARAARKKGSQFSTPPEKQKTERDFQIMISALSAVSSFIRLFSSAESLEKERFLLIHQEEKITNRRDPGERREGEIFIK